jgi:hypothetical protein
LTVPFLASPIMQHWNWGIPVTIPEPSHAGAQPLGWDLLKFNQIGLFDLRRRMGVFPSEPGVYDKHRAQFDAADLAWFASGLSTDVLHLTQNAFLPEFNGLRQGMPSGTAGSQARAVIRTRIQKLTFDLVCIISICTQILIIFLMHVVQAALWDRTFGGATLILHVEGTTRPNSPRLPEYVKSDVYFPGYLIEAEPRFSPIISELVQKFIINIGMPVIGRWEQCARSIWPMTQGAGAGTPSPYPSQPMQPEAKPKGSSTFVYHGRLRDDDEYQEDEISQSMVDMVNMMEERDTYKTQLYALQSLLSATEKSLAESLAREGELRSELNNARSVQLTGTDARANRHASPSRISHHTSPMARISPHISRIASPTHSDRLDSFTSPTQAARIGNTFRSPSRAVSSTHSDRPDGFTSPTPARIGNTFGSPSHASPIGRRLFGNRSEGPSESSTPPEIDALAAYYDFLNNHDLTCLRSTLDIIRRIPISSWALQLEKAGVPFDLIDPLMVLMAALI